jgi:hypothetical protein
MTCYSCRWSIGAMDGLWCELHRIKAVRICERLCYEAGTDEGERDA